MNRSYSKLRHIQNANLLLESRILGMYNILNEDNVSPTGTPTEYQYQWSNASPGQSIKVGLNNEKIRHYEQMTKEINLNDVESWVDNSVTLISAALEGIPGVGNLASAIIDIAQSLSFFVRIFTTSDENKKVQYVIDGITTGAMAVVPLAGNLVSLGLRGLVKKFLDMTHSQVAVWLKNNGINIRGGRIFLSNKTPFRYAWLAALIAYTTHKSVDVLTEIKTYSDNWIGLLKSVKHLFNKIIYLPLVSSYNKAIDYVISLFKDLKATAEEFEPIADKSKITQSGRPMIGDGNKEAIIIVGSYGDQENFFNRASELIDMGYETNESKSPDGNIRLGIVVKYNNDSELNSVLEKIKKEVAPKAWILK